MFKFSLSCVLLLGALAGPATATPAPASSAPMNAAPSRAEFATDSTTAVPIGPFSTYAVAIAKKLNLENLGHEVSLPYLLEDGWWIDVEP